MERLIIFMQPKNPQTYLRQLNQTVVQKKKSEIDVFDIEGLP